MNLKKELGLRIKELRTKNKLTQERVAELVDITPKYQSRVETGSHFPSAELIEKYAQVFSTSPANVIRIEAKEDKETMIKQITEMLSKASPEEVKKIYRLVCG